MDFSPREDFVPTQQSWKMAGVDSSVLITLYML